MSNPKGAPQNLAPPWEKGKNGWPGGVKPEGVGRPKNRLKAFNEKSEDRVSFDDVRRMTERLIVSSIDELEAIKDDKENPSLVVVFAAAILADKKRGITTTYQTLMDRILGKAIQPTVGVVDNDLHALTAEEYEAKKADFLTKNLGRAQKIVGDQLGQE
jgi:hypothetical protein